MAYADLLNKENIDSEYLVILSPKISTTGFSLFSGSVYSKSFSLGYVSAVTEDGESLTAGVSSTLSAGEFYYDAVSETLYVRMSDSSNPSGKFVVASFDLYYGTKDEHWYRDPLDDASDEIYFAAKVKKTPQIKLDISESLVGYQAINRSDVTLINAEHDFEPILYSASFSKARIQVFNILRASVTADLDIDNIKLVYDGFCGSLTRYQGGEVTLDTTSGEDELSQEFRNDSSSFYSSSDFPALDPNRAGAAIRYVYGVVDGFVPVNVDYVEYSTATTSDNRVWSVLGEQTNLSNLTKTVGGGVHTATRTFLTSVLGLRIGDSVHMDRAAGTDEYVFVTSVGASFIDHAALSGGAMVNGDTVKRSFVGNVTIVQGAAIYQPMFGRDYTTSGALAGGCSGFTFVNDFESALSMNTLTPNDRVFCRVYGRQNDLTLSALSFGSNDSESGNIANPVMVILDLFKRVLGIAESRINAASFIATLALRTDALGFAIPDESSAQMPAVKEILINIMKTSLLGLYIDSDLKWTIKAVEPLGSVDLSTDDFEIIKGSFGYDLNYRDVLSDVIVEYRAREESTQPRSSSAITDSVSSQSETAKYLHGINKSATLSSLHFKEADAQTLSDRYLFIFGDRKGVVSIKAKNRFFESQIGDVLSISRTKMLGFSYDGETENTRDFSIVSVNKNRTEVTISADDQKGIEDNSGSW